MQIRELMSTPAHTVGPDDSLVTAAERMAQFDLGFLPVANEERLVGIVTDRDLVVHGIAERRAFDAPVSDVMTKDIRYCFDDDTVNEIAANLGDQQVRRLPVVNRDKQLVGIVSLADICREHDHHDVSADALSDITRKGGTHNQAMNHPH